jgi:hypothetical protein
MSSLQPITIAAQLESNDGTLLGEAEEQSERQEGHQSRGGVDLQVQGVL